VSCPTLQFSFFVDVLQVQTDVLLGRLEQLRHMLLSEPDSDGVVSGGGPWEDATPLGWGNNLEPIPRVARSSQPWAEGRNPFGIGECLLIRVLP